MARPCACRVPAIPAGTLAASPAAPGASERRPRRWRLSGAGKTGAAAGTYSSREDSELKHAECTIKTHLVLLRVLVLGRCTNEPVTHENGRSLQIISRRGGARRGSHLRQGIRLVRLLI
uniref:Uncharacterized protein n=1 Tax=Pseudomonas fluorescens TaxID=294 RepID=Q9AJ69_PSEFL|nr:unknown [Pseudomonas fluorescens]